MILRQLVTATTQNIKPEYLIREMVASECRNQIRPASEWANRGPATRDLRQQCPKTALSYPHTDNCPSSPLPFLATGLTCDATCDPTTQ